MIENVQGLKAIPVPLNGGIDEESPVDALAIEDSVKMTNWRLSKNGTRIQKRVGLQEEVRIAVPDPCGRPTTYEDVYGYATYWNATPVFCELAIIESEMQRKVGGAAWANIKTWTGVLDHVVKPLEIQGKQFVITEKGSCVIQADGGVRQIGISAPLTMPTASAAYIPGVTPYLNETFSGYADTAAMTAGGWADLDAGTGSASTLDSTDPNGDVGPDADHKSMLLTSTWGVLMGGPLARRRKYLTVCIPTTFAFEIITYHDIYSNLLNSALIEIDNGSNDFLFAVAADGAWWVGSGLPNDMKRIITATVPLNKWIKWNFSITKKVDIPGTVIEAFVSWDSILQGSGSVTVFAPATSDIGASPNLARVELKTVGSNQTYIDHFRIDTAEAGSSTITGLYRYAVTYLRDGDFGCESNPIRSQIGTPSFTGAGLNDMTVDADSEYTGPVTKTIRVQVKSVTPDIIEWSEDAGVNWNATLAMGSKVYIGYGITVKFAAITGHTAGNYWEIVCTACSVMAMNQQITIASIPVSSDAQVTARKIYRTTAGGATFYYLTTIYDNTTATFIDNYPDSTLGDEMEIDRDLFSDVSSTIGKFSEWWDDRLWIADHVQNIVYYSAVRSGGGVPEEFSITDRFIPIRKGDQGDVITAMIAFKDALYVFKRNDIFIIQKTMYGYGVYHLNSDVGCIADGCVLVANDVIMFPSERGMELYDGVKPYTPDFSLAINKTFLSADPAGYKYMSMVHDKEYNEVWLSIPSRVSSGTPTTIVWNYIRNKFYLFQFYKTPSCLVACKDSTGKRVVKMGTRDGYVLLCDYGTADNTTVITATYRKGWMDMEAHGIGRLIKVKYELPATKTITANVYVDMDKDVFRTSALTGITPAATDIDIRRVIGDKAELGTRHRWISFEFINAEDCGGDCKINEAYLFVKPIVIKNKTYAD